MTSTTDVAGWVADSDEPWTRYRALLDLEERSPEDRVVQASRQAMLHNAAIRELVARAATWPGYPLKRHNDAAHPLYAIATLADFGFDRSDEEIDRIGAAILERFDGDQFETLLWLPRFLTKDAEDTERWSWMLCDAPTLLYALLTFGYEDEASVRTAVAVLTELVAEDGWRCGASSQLPNFSGPGRKADPCPMATTYALKALAQSAESGSDPSVDRGVDSLLAHWEHQSDYKLKMFGIGTDFRKIKYPFVWYDILHVGDVLSRFPGARRDARLRDMVSEITAQADGDGRYTAGSMYRAWKGWSFADKTKPSPWLTMLALRIEKRLRST